MNKPPAYYRARISKIKEEINKEYDEFRLRFLRNGYVPDLIIKDCNAFDNSPLTFLEITSFDTWFNMYPDKVCGKTETTTIRFFPLVVKGTKEDVIKTIKLNLDNHNNNDLDIKIKIAKAKLKLLKLKF